MIHSSSSRISYISALSDELLVEILCRLDSPKNATQCKCISKRWFSLVNTSYNSYFLRRWRKIHQEEDDVLPIALLTQYQHLSPLAAARGDNQEKNHHEFDYPFTNSYDQNLLPFKSLNFLSHYSTSVLSNEPIYILATYKDTIVCCPSKTDHSVYYICNPFTRQCTALPPPPQPEAPGIEVGVIFFDNESGFNFKLMRVIPSTFYTIELVQIFASEDRSGKWKQIVVPKCFDHAPVSYNGMLVWFKNSSEARILGFEFNPDCVNVNANSYTRFSLPPGFHRAHKFSSKIGVCRGCLRIAQLVHKSPGHATKKFGLELFVWQLDSHSRFWELVHELDFSKVKGSSGSSIARRCYRNKNRRFKSSILALHPHDGDILYLLFALPAARSSNHVSSYVFLCNLRKRTLEVIRGLPTHSCKVFPLMQPSWPTSVRVLQSQP